MKRFCIKCGKEIQDNAEFCPFCGAAQNTNAGTTNQGTTQATVNMQTVQPTSTLDQPYNENDDPNLINSTKLLFKDSFKVNKRVGRADYWWGLLGISLITVAISFVYGIMMGITGVGAELEYNIDGSPTGATIAAFVFLAMILAYSIYVFIIGLTAQFRRLHDIGLSGAFWLINFVPVVGSLAVLIMMLQPSKQNGNRYINN